jgi:protein-S-isoprenylcysteine O-methyltransferase Ste14
VSVPLPITQTADPRPVSAVGHGVGICGLIGLIVAVLIARNFGVIAGAINFPMLPEFGGKYPAIADGRYSSLISVAFCGIPMIAWSIFKDKVHLRASTGIDWAQKHDVSEVIDDSIIKIAGLWATWAMIAGVYCICRFYWRDMYLFSMEMFQLAIIPLVLICVPYVIWLDRLLINRRDGAWHFGAWLAGRDDWDKDEILHHLRAWAVKGFFLAFMISIVPGGFQNAVTMDFGSMANNPAALASGLIGLMFLVDVQVATVGYMVTMKPLDAHIRTANPYLSGWVAALICYPPFVLMNDGGILNYHVNARDWDYWLQGHSALMYIWGSALVLLTAVYAWATVAFGPRFSNLTNRGILTHGPYRWTRHPAYLCKNLYWWMAGMPFLVTSGSKTDMIRNTVILGAVSAVYYWRAKTEEKHLMADADYRTYSAWMDRNGPVPRLFARIKRLAGNRARPLSALIEPAE